MIMLVAMYEVWAMNWNIAMLALRAISTTPPESGMESFHTMNEIVVDHGNYPATTKNFSKNE